MPRFDFNQLSTFNSQLSTLNPEPAALPPVCCYSCNGRDCSIVSRSKLRSKNWLRFRWLNRGSAILQVFRRSEVTDLMRHTSRSLIRQVLIRRKNRVVWHRTCFHSRQRVRDPLIATSRLGEQLDKRLRKQRAHRPVETGCHPTPTAPCRPRTEGREDPHPRGLFPFFGRQPSRLLYEQMSLSGGCHLNTLKP